MCIRDSRIERAPDELGQLRHAARPAFSAHRRAGLRGRCHVDQEAGLAEQSDARAIVTPEGLAPQLEQQHAPRRGSGHQDAKPALDLVDEGDGHVDVDATIVQREALEALVAGLGEKRLHRRFVRGTAEQDCARAVAWSGRYLQVTLMSIPVGGDIGLEAHPETDQFLRLDAGRGRVQMGTTKDTLTFEREVGDGWCVLVPAGTWHNITNIGTDPMQVYTIYAPAHHQPRKVQATAAAASADRDDAPAAWSVQPTHAPDEHG